MIKPPSCLTSIEPKETMTLDVPDALFTYSALGKGIPCIAFTGSENIGHNPKLEIPEEYTLVLRLMGN